MLTSSWTNCPVVRHEDSVFAPPRTAIGRVESDCHIAEAQVIAVSRHLFRRRYGTRRQQHKLYRTPTCDNSKVYVSTLYSANQRICKHAGRDKEVIRFADPDNSLTIQDASPKCVNGWI